MACDTVVLSQPWQWLHDEHVEGSTLRDLSTLHNIMYKPKAVTASLAQKTGRKIYIAALFTQCLVLSIPKLASCQVNCCIDNKHEMQRQSLASNQLV